MPTTTAADAQGLCNFVDLSPSPFHVCATVAAALADAGFTQLTETEVWPSEPGRYYLLRGGSLIAWSTEGADGDPARPFRIVGGHTDSPNLRVKQHPDLTSAGWQLVGLEPYGGSLAELVAGPRSRHLRPAHRTDRHRGRGRPRARRSADPARAATRHPPVGGPQGRATGSAAPRERRVGSGHRAAVLPRLPRGGRRGGGRRDPGLGADDPRSRPVHPDRGGCGPAQRAAPGQPGHLLRRDRGAARGRRPRRRERWPGAGARAVRPRGGRQHVRPRGVLRPVDHRARTGRAGPGRRPRGLPPDDGRLGGGLRRHGSCHPPELPPTATSPPTASR